LGFFRQQFAPMDFWGLTLRPMGDCFLQIGRSCGAKPPDSQRRIISVREKELSWHQMKFTTENLSRMDSFLLLKRPFEMNAGGTPALLKRQFRAS
jgi:hypothetical protein